MTDYFDEFIPLDRTFRELTHAECGGDDAEFTRKIGSETLHWSDLLSAHRVILLSEAGSGKTAEIRNAARKQCLENKHAFFVRIENVSQELGDAFEEGTFEEFNAWLDSNEEGWLLLDSVDEARLRDPKDFERAIKKLGKILSPAMQRVHIVISSRASAWRAKTDLLLCRRELPYHMAEKAIGDEAPEKKLTKISTNNTNADTSPTAPFKIVALDDLHSTQVEAFLRGKGVEDSTAFCDAIGRKDAWSLTTRPQDLGELIEFWKDHQRIGSRLELMRSSITRRLEERDQNRSEIRPFSIEKLRFGARLVAAAATLTQEPAIRVPDGSDNARGIPVREVLTEWNDIDCATLLSRPIFDEGIYGTVRFHHRSVREYMTAEWLHALIVDEGSRSKIEALFFRSQYGIEVVVPSMRPVLPWLVLLDERILGRVYRLAPEIIFEGGDPSALPRETRSKILRQACELLAQPAHGQSLTDYSAVQRFANIDLTDDVKALLAQYGDDDDIAWFLLRMIWLGEIRGAASEAKHFALNSRAKYTRIAAFRALSVVGSDMDRLEVRRAFLAEDGELKRDWLAELIPSLPQNEHAVAWLVEAIERTSAKKRFEVDGLTDALIQLASDWPLSLMPMIVTGIHSLLHKPPFIKQRSCEISDRHAWLASAAAKSILRLVEARDRSALGQAALSTLHKLVFSQDYYYDKDLLEIRGSLERRIVEWPELNHALFWLSVAERRAWLHAERGERLIDYWSVGIFGRLWRFSSDNFECICEDISTRPILDDRLVALTLAFSLYRENGRPAVWRAKLKRLAASELELKLALDNLLHPPASGRQKWRNEEVRLKRRAAQRAEQQEAEKRRWHEYLTTNSEALRSPEKIGVLTNAQLYLLERLRESGSNGSEKWSGYNWRLLIPVFGEEVARAFRDGAVRFWRSYVPKLLSEGAEANSIPFSVFFGLAGLSIEAQEEPNWLSVLSRDEAELATRYALREINGFPNWLPNLHVRYSKAVIHVVTTEIDYELRNENPENQNLYVLHGVSQSGNWMWDHLAPLILERLRKPPKNIRNLRDMIRIVQGSSIDGSVIAKLAAQKSKATKSLTTAPMWFAVWVGVEPAIAMSILKARLAEIEKESDQTLFAMRFITELIGGRRENSNSRQAYRTVECMKSLYLLLHS